MFNWKEGYAIGVSKIDEQHQELFKIGNEVLGLTEKAKGEDGFFYVAEQVQKLVVYASNHFSEEEKIMIARDYPEREAHIAEHRKFMEIVGQFEIDEESDERKETVIKMLKLVAVWIDKHILTVDARLGAFLKEEQ